MTAVPALTRSQFGRPAAPVRIVHLGLGNFTRAHQAWYTEHASDRDDWGIAAFTGRRPTMAELLTPQDGLYTLVTKGAEGDSYEVISSVSHVHPASDFAALVRYFASPELAVVTSTVTEAGYYRASDGSLDVADAAVAADLIAVRELLENGAPSVEDIAALQVVTSPVRVMAGLLARRAAGVGPLTILPCDNIPDNGEAFGRVVRDAAAATDSSLVDWMGENVAWATSMVDRITPATTDTEIADVEAAQGYHDAAPVPTEPFSEWVISGQFPAGRPDWESAGVQIVDEVEPYEQRKLWMLNGSHSLMAYAGPILGIETVSEGMADERVRELVQTWWSEAGPGLSVPWEEYAAALVERYENANIRHLLAQIAADGSQKIAVRIVPTLRRFRAQGETPKAAVTAVAAWLLHLRGHGAPVKDAAKDKVVALVGGTLEEDAANVLGFVAPDLAGDTELVRAIAEAAEQLLA
ncbi:mannitol dehydrogenase family protein [Tessaracoccus oleiagri]|uniref:Fructuronate reductase n=1 Tax=Tessaracoccus oleiagri TaxID=686624 RepID=A0A1G9IAJ5_9ACTN|nr:mannitol dehydrogenase family protein [Tessaracoccus oleiagri]SDL22221.1 fructuronate reductase [Tessaracoccus oleiagri]